MSKSIIYGLSSLLIVSTFIFLVYKIDTSNKIRDFNANSDIYENDLVMNNVLYEYKVDFGDVDVGFTSKAQVVIDNLEKEYVTIDILNCSIAKGDIVSKDESLDTDGVVLSQYNSYVVDIVQIENVSRVTLYNLDNLSFQVFIDSDLYTMFFELTEASIVLGNGDLVDLRVDYVDYKVVNDKVMVLLKMNFTGNNFHRFVQGQELNVQFNLYTLKSKYIINKSNFVPNEQYVVINEQNEVIKRVIYVMDEGLLYYSIYYTDIKSGDRILVLGD